MMKKRILSLLLALIMLASVCALPVAARVANPYPYSQTIDGVTTIPCT